MAGLPTELCVTKQGGCGQVSQCAANESSCALVASFCSHTAEFDYLKSVDIDERITHLEFCHAAQPGSLLLTTNGA